MEKKTKLLRILKKLSPEDATSVTLDTAINEIEKFGRILNLAPLLEAIDSIKSHYSTKSKEVVEHVANQIAELKNTLEQDRIKFENARKNLIGNNELKVNEIKGQIQSIQDYMRGLASTESVALLEEKLSQINTLKSSLDSLNSSFVLYKTNKENEPKINSVDIDTHKGDIKSIQELIEKIRVDLVNKISSLGGGSANQQINVNSSVMSSRYADFNLVSNTAIRWVASEDTTNKRVNIVASLISGGAGGGGINVETPTGDVDGVNTAFTVANEPKYVIADGISYFSGAGYSYSAPTITMTSPPVSYIRNIY